MEIANENDIIIAHANQILITAQLFFFTIYTIIGQQNEYIEHVITCIVKMF